MSELSVSVTLTSSRKDRSLEPLWINAR